MTVTRTVQSGTSSPLYGTNRSGTNRSTKKLNLIWSYSGISQNLFYTPLYLTYNGFVKGVFSYG